VQALSALAATASAVFSSAELYQRVAEEKERSEAILANIADGIVAVDRDGRIVLWNDAAVQITGVPREEAIGRTTAQVLHRDLESEGTGPGGSRLVSLSRGGEEMWLSLSEAVMRDPVGAVAGRIFAFRDISSERLVEQMKSDFVSTVSHELRTPLTSIKGFTDLILEGDAGPISPEVHELLAIVQSSADQLVAITNDILETSRIEAGQVTINAQPINLVESIYMIADAIRPLIASKQQALAIDLPPDLPLIAADRDRLAQILTNLLSNAHKYTPAQGHIRVQAYLADDRDAQYPAAVASSAAWLVVGVADDGIGIAPQDQEQLFTRFYRVNNPVARRAGGTGLGLSITRSLVELHGGCIWLQSEPDHGSTFFFSLPTLIEHAGPERKQAWHAS
jgi:PAS domain S-box-containing protein